MFGISGEHLLILGIILLVFGPRRLPELGHKLGRAYRNFKDGLQGVEEAQYRRLGDSGKTENSPTKPDELDQQDPQKTDRQG